MRIMRASGLMRGSRRQRLDAGKEKGCEYKAGVPHRVETRFNAVNAR
jgi:hypothetical protein